MLKEIKIGYELGTGEEVNIKPSHLIVTGITQLSGKTTTLEALIKRSGLKAIVFKTKIGEKSFTEGTETAPFFRDRNDYEFVRSLIEAYSREKLNIEKGTLMRLCKGAESLLGVKMKVDEALEEGKLRGINLEIHTRLQHYLANLIPQIQYANLSSTLNVYEGLNIMNLERFSEEAQSLIIQAVADEVMKTMKETIVIIPEAWKFIPQKYNNPCKRVVESFIRQGATNNNYIWIDSQEMAGVDKTPLKQISTWILGYQAERNEVKHTLDQIALPKKSKPKEDEIMNLKIGHFIISSGDRVVKVYVQPSWLPDNIASDIAKGNLKVDDVQAPSNLTPLSIHSQNTTPIPQSMGPMYDDKWIRKQLVEMRGDFFNKIEEIQTISQNMASDIFKIKSQSPQATVDIDEIVSLVMQKMPVSAGISSSPINEEEIIAKVLARIPKTAGGGVTYTVAPLVKIKQDFLKAAKDKILKDVLTLEPESKKILRFIESQGKGCKISPIISNCLYLSATSGGTRDRVSKRLKEMVNLEIVRTDKNKIYYPNLKERIEVLTGIHEATDKDIQQVYDHILAEIIQEGG